MYYPIFVKFKSSVNLQFKQTWILCINYDQHFVNSFEFLGSNQYIDIQTDEQTLTKVSKLLICRYVSDD